MNSSRIGQRGQGMTEYLVVVALVALGAVGVYQAFGLTLQSQTQAMAKVLAGDDGATARTAASAAATNAGVAGRTLKSFADPGTPADTNKIPQTASNSAGPAAK